MNMDAIAFIGIPAFLMSRGGIRDPSHMSEFAGRREEAVELRSTGQPRAAVPT
jgi:hypothetical protein